jgi:transposase InsO family protein
MEMHTNKGKQPVKSLCELFGKTKQAYYQRVSYIYQEEVKGDILYQTVIKYRKYMPRIGGRKLQYLINNELPKELQVGRDKFFNWLRDNNLLVKRRRIRIYTTNSHHWLHKYPNLIKGFAPTTPNQLWVSDITYIKTDEGVMYLFLITDAFSKKIIGWKLADNLRAENAVMALKSAIKQWNNVDCKLIHHSDRGVQYCSEEYVRLLQKNNIKISMTQDGNPLDNAIAERVNGILKDEWLYQMSFKTKRSATVQLFYIIKRYNNLRPHLSLGMKTPEQVHKNSTPGEVPRRLWKNYYHQKNAMGCRENV